MLPNELLLQIYNYTDCETKIKLNTVFKWSYYDINPLQNVFKRFTPPKYYDFFHNYNLLTANYIMLRSLLIKGLPKTTTTI